MNGDDRDDNPGSEPAHGGEPESRAPGDEPIVVATTDPAVAAASKPGGPDAPPFDQAMVVQTGPHRVGEPPNPAGPAQGQDRPRGDDAKAKHPADHKPAPAPSGLARFVLPAVIGLACGVGGAFAYSRFEGSRAKDQSSQSGDQKAQAKEKDDPGKESEPGSDQTAFAPPREGDKFQDQLQHLSERMDQLEQRFATMTMPRDASPPDLSQIRVKVGEMTRAVGEMANIAPRFQQVEQRLEAMQDGLKAVRNRLAADKPQPVASPSAPGAGFEPAAVPAPGSAPPPPSNPVGATMTDGVALFKKGEYAKADDLFGRLQLTDPDDARVWYYSSLSHGLATGKWDGETKRLVQQGADRERLGSPSGPEIDATFADLNPALGKDWLATYRTQLVKH